MRYLLSILGILLVVGVLGATKFSQVSMLIGFGEKMKAAGPPPETVATGVVQKQSWNDGIEGIASVVAASGVTLSNDAPGIVTRIHFDSGAIVKQGQMLVELDSSVERAQLASLRSKVQLAEASLSRSQSLVESGAISKAQSDVDKANYKGLIADEQALVAQIARRVVSAPFGGKLGIRAINLGQYLAPGTAITVLESSKSVYVDFTVPQARLPELRVGMPIRAFTESNGTAVATGAVTAIEPTVDVATRNVKVRASVDDPERRLQPGMFMRVRVEQPSQREVTTVPATAVVHASYGDSVFCVETAGAGTGQTPTPPRKVARQQFVKLGESRGDYVAVIDGVSQGQEIVTAGAFKLKNGIPVVVNNAVQVDPQLFPNPANR